MRKTKFKLKLLFTYILIIGSFLDLPHCYHLRKHFLKDKKKDEYWNYLNTTDGAWNQKYCN